MRQKIVNPQFSNLYTDADKISSLCTCKNKYHARNIQFKTLLRQKKLENVKFFSLNYFYRWDDDFLSFEGSVFLECFITLLILLAVLCKYRRFVRPFSLDFRSWELKIIEYWKPQFRSLLLLSEFFRWFFYMFKPFLEWSNVVSKTVPNHRGLSVIVYDTSLCSDSHSQLFSKFAFRLCRLRCARLKIVLRDITSSVYI